MFIIWFRVALILTIPLTLGLKVILGDMIHLKGWIGLFIDAGEIWDEIES